MNNLLQEQSGVADSNEKGKRVGNTRLMQELKPPSSNPVLLAIPGSCFYKNNYGILVCTLSFSYQMLIATQHLHKEFSLETLIITLCSVLLSNWRHL